MSIEGEVLSSAMGQKEQIDQRTREEKIQVLKEIEGDIVSFMSRVNSFMTDQTILDYNVKLQESFTKISKDFFQAGSAVDALGFNEKFEQAKNQILKGNEEASFKALMSDGYKMINGIRNRVGTKGVDNSIKYLIQVPGKGGWQSRTGVLTEEDYLEAVEFSLSSLDFGLKGIINSKNKKLTRRNALNVFYGKGIGATEEFGESFGQAFDYLMANFDKTVVSTKLKYRRKGKKGTEAYVKDLPVSRKFELFTDIARQGESFAKEFLNSPGLISQKARDVFDNKAFYRGGDVGNYQLKYYSEFAGANTTSLNTILTACDEVLRTIHAAEQKVFSNVDTTNNTIIQKEIKSMAIDQSIQDYAFEMVQKMLGIT